MRLAAGLFHVAEFLQVFLLVASYVIVVFLHIAVRLIVHHMPCVVVAALAALPEVADLVSRC